MLLRLVGSASSVSRVNWVVAAVDLTSTTGDAPDTVMVSASEPTGSGTSSLAVKPTVSRTPSRRTVWKPGIEYSTVYVPIGSGVKRYSPRSSVTLTTDGT